MSTSMETLAQELTAFSGLFGVEYYQDHERISKPAVISLIRDVPEANVLWKSADRKMTTAWILFGAQVGFLVWQLNTDDSTQIRAPAIGVLSSGLASAGFAIAANGLRKRAILRYNQEITGDISLTPTANGLGLVVDF